MVRRARDLGEVIPGAMLWMRRRRSRYSSIEVREGPDIVFYCQLLLLIVAIICK